ncbi:MAG: recombinase family protein, partial [Kofleriaceae bacterium]|nr:recombinase family protein [Kofleriaceae bacterium]
MIRLYLRRSESDGQEYSLTTQRAGAIRWIAGSAFAGDQIVDYIDDGLAGDDFTRPALRKLIAEAQAGDVIVCRDQSRVGRDAV